MTSPVFNQIAYRIRRDNGSETTATWRQAINTVDTVDIGDTIRVRFRIDETASRAWTNKTWNLYYSLNAGAYTAVSTTTPIEWAASSNFAQGDDCTAQLSGGTGTFVTANAGMCQSAGATNSGTAGYLFEVEYCLKFDPAQVTLNDTISLEVYDGTGAIGSYTNVPTLTLIARKVNVTDGTTLGDTPALSAPYSPFFVNVTDNVTPADGTTTASFVYADRLALTRTPSTSSDDADMSGVALASGRNVTDTTPVTVTGTTLQMGRTSSTTVNVAGIRFSNLAVNGDITLSEAKLELWPNADQSIDPFYVGLYVSAQAADSASAFTATDGNLNVSARPRTTAYTTVTVPSLFTDTPLIMDVTSAVSEVLSRAGWISGNALVLLIDVDPATDASYNGIFDAYDGGVSSRYPRLSLVYSASTTPHPHVTDDTSAGESVTVAPLGLPATALSEGLSVGDSATVTRLDAATRTPSVTDAAALGESVTLSLPLPFAPVTDAVSLGESSALVPLALTPIQVSDALTVQDTPVLQRTGGEPAQTINVSDGVAVADAVAYYSDDVAVGEWFILSINAPTPFAVNVTDGASLGESLSAAPLALVASATVDAVSVGENVQARAVDLSASATDGLSIGDSATSSLGVLRLASTDNAAVADSAAASVTVPGTPIINVTDGVTVGEVSALSIGLPPISATDSLSVGESVTLSPLSINASSTDSASLGDSASASPVAPTQIGVTDDTLVGESVSVSRTIPGTPIINASDGITLGESINVVIGTLSPTSTDSITLGETLTLRLPASLIASLSEGVTLSDSAGVSVAAVGVYVLSTADGVVVSDTPLVDSHLLIVSVSDGTVVGEIRALQALSPGVFSISVTDDAAAAESLALRTALFGPALVDNQGVSETVAVVVNAVGAITINKTDGVSLGEALSLSRLLLSINTSGAVSLSDSVLVGFGGVGQARFKGMWRGMRKKEQ